MNRTLESATTIIEAAEIERIRQISGSFKTRIDNPAEAGEVDFNLEFKGRCADRIENHFLVLVSFKAIIREKDAGKPPLVDARAGFEIRYRLPADFQVTKKQLNDFAKINGVFNAWPYFREFLQSSFQRMELPTPMLPLFRLREFFPPADEQVSEPD